MSAIALLALAAALPRALESHRLRPVGAGAPGDLLSDLRPLLGRYLGLRAAHN